MIKRVENSSEIFSPGLVIFRELLEQNLAEIVRVARDPARLRPHCKTHKMPEITRLELARGITKHKCATLAEAEMLAQAGARDIFLAYNLVGPNIGRAVALMAKYPQVTLACTADDERAIAALGAAMTAAGKSCGVLLDLDTGLGRTGTTPGPRAIELYRRIAATPGLAPAGLHWYDGQHHQTDLAERRTAVLAGWKQATALRDELVKLGLLVPRIVAGGTGAFPVYAELDDPTLELSPGTVVLHDAGYARQFPDLKFTPAAMLLTRVISRPTPDRVTCDLGYKACASDPPAGKRLSFPDLPDAEEVLQNEEHLVLRTSRAAEFTPGDELWAIPRHICPTTALHRTATIVSGGRVVGEWEITARDRRLTV